MQFDLTVPGGVVDYLDERAPFASGSVVSLTGGHANFTYRTTLRAPYAAQGVDGLVHTMIMKHAEPYMALIKEMPFAVERQDYECLALKTIPGIVALPPIISIPRLFHQDRVHHVMLMSDSGADCQTLCDVLKSGPLRDNISRDFGANLGTFIARLHTGTQKPAPGTLAHTAKIKFSKNHEGDMVACDVFYENIVSTFTANSHPPLLSPPLALDATTLAKLDAAARKSKTRIQASTDVVLMGDFRPGNFLVVLEPTPHITIVDWEIARTGFPGMDIGTCLAELLLIRTFHRASRHCVDILVEAFMKNYRDMMLKNLKARADAERRLTLTARDAATHVGAYVITLAPRMHWGGPELTREVVQEGVEYILRAADQDDAWLRRSIVGGLWG